MDDVPDARTIWKYRDDLTKAGAYDRLFKDFYEHLASKGLIVNEGKIIDASFVVAPRQRDTREENQKIKAGQGHELWNDKPHKKCHKDIDACVAMTNLTYNIARFIQIQRYHHDWITVTQ